MNKIHAEVIDNVMALQLDKAEVEQTIAYKNSEKQLKEYEDEIIKTVDSSLFSDYGEIRIDIESLFYKYGFLDGIKFHQSLAIHSTNEIIDNIEKINENSSEE